MKAIHVAATLGMTVMAGCTLGPDYQAPVSPPTATGPLQSVDPALETTGALPDKWWRLYDDPELDKLLDQAFAANLDLKAAEAHLGAARAVLEAARAGLYPATTIKAGASYGRDATTNEILEYTGRKPFTDRTFDALFDVSYEVDLFGRVRRSIEVAAANAEADVAARDALRVTIAAETARAYAQICTTGEAIAVAERSLALVTREHDIVERRRLAGASSDFDVTRATALVAQTRSNLPPLHGQQRAALFQLAALLGRTPAEAPAEVTGCAMPPLLKAPIPVGDGAELLRRRPDIREADRALAAAIAGIGVARADLYPRVTLGGLYGGVADKVSLLPTDGALTWGVGPSISWSFPNLAAPLARVHQAGANAETALAKFDGAVLMALKETEQALSTYSAELAHHRDLVDFQVNQRRAYDLAHDQLGEGALSPLDLLTTEQLVVAADAAVAASDAALVQDQIAVFKALGGGWQDMPAPAG